MRRQLFLLSLAGLIVASAGLSCSSEESVASPRTPSKPPSIRLPSQLLGLTVGTEDVGSRVQQADQPYIDSVGLFAFRKKNDLLEATLQVSRFTPDARPDRSEFRGSIISRIGGTSPRVVRAGSQTVYLTSGRNQVVFIWFEKRGFFVLTVRRDYPFPRTLLRRLVGRNLEV